MRFIPRATPSTARAEPLPQLTSVLGKRGPNFKIEGAYKEGTIYEGGISIVKESGCSYIAARSGVDLGKPTINSSDWSILAMKGRDAPPIPTDAWKSYVEDQAVKQAKAMHMELEEKMLMFSARSVDAYFDDLDAQMQVG